MFSCEYCKIFKNFILVKIANNCFCSSRFLLLIFLFGSLFLLLIQQAFFKGSLQGLKSSPQGVQWQAPLLFEKKKNQPKWSLVEIRCHSLYHSLPFLITRCHSLSLVVPLVVIPYHSLYYSLSLIITRCTTRLSFYKRYFHLVQSINT